MKLNSINLFEFSTIFFTNTEYIQIFKDFIIFIYSLKVHNFFFLFLVFMVEYIYNGYTQYLSIKLPSISFFSLART